ncbi:hypothetical protein PG989_008332 [Apiospora arundinis]
MYGTVKSALSIASLPQLRIQSSHLNRHKLPTWTQADSPPPILQSPTYKRPINRLLHISSRIIRQADFLAQVNV